MTQATFMERRTEGWTKLESFIGRSARRGLRALTPDDIGEFGRLYRTATSDLAYARGHEFDPALLAYLNRLVARSHATIYGSQADTGASRLATFFSTTFPQEVRRSIVPFTLCTALTIVSAIIAYVVVMTHRGDAYALLPAQMIPDEIKKSLHDSNFGFGSTNSPEMASAIITNNVKVAALCFAGGATLGLFTLYEIIFNGLMVGGVAALFTHAGFGYDFWATVAPHGFIELTAIQLAGAAGLLLGAAIVAPGRLRRRDAMKANSARAGVLFAGVASMLLVAGTIEGFFSPLRLPPEIRISFGVLTALGLLAYFGFAGRTSPIKRPVP